MRTASVMASLFGFAVAAVPAYAANVTTLGSFDGVNGITPLSSLIADADGTLYGTTLGFNQNLPGSLFSLSTDGTLKKLPGPSGFFEGRLLQNASGTLFGTTADSVFSLSRAGTFTTLATFSNGQRPRGGLIADASGTFYGTTFRGGAFDEGTVFSLAPSGVSRSYSLTTLANFNGANGALPIGELVADATGVLYGTTSSGGAFGQGTVFSIDRTGTLATLVDFNGANGSLPSGGLIVDASGTLYGTTTGGGVSNAGTVFSLTSTGTFTTLASFNGANGANPLGSLIADSFGTLFGTTETGGTSALGTRTRGTVFSLSSAGTLTTVATFQSGNGGYSPRAGLLADAAGVLYGTTALGGTSGMGTIFSIKDSGFNRPVVAAVPEPDSWAMLIAGFGMIGGAARRLRAKAAQGNPA